jgi:hypothetical protein
MYTALPIIHFVPTVNYVPPDDEYQCPLYKTTVRAGILSTERATVGQHFTATTSAHQLAVPVRFAQRDPIRSLLVIGVLPTVPCRLTRICC